MNINIKTGFNKNLFSDGAQTNVAVAEAALLNAGVTIYMVWKQTGRRKQHKEKAIYIHLCPVKGQYRLEKKKIK